MTLERMRWSAQHGGRWDARLSGLRRLAWEHLTERLEARPLTGYGFGRRILAGDGEGAVRFVHLEVPLEILQERVAHRPGHYMPPSLLGSQLATLEESRTALRVDGSRPVPEVVQAIVKALRVILSEGEKRTGLRGLNRTLWDARHEAGHGRRPPHGDLARHERVPLDQGRIADPDHHRTGGDDDSVLQDG